MLFVSIVLGGFALQKKKQSSDSNVQVNKQRVLQRLKNIHLNQM